MGSSIGERLKQALNHANVKAANAPALTSPAMPMPKPSPLPPAPASTPPPVEAPAKQLAHTPASSFNMHGYGGAPSLQQAQGPALNAGSAPPPEPPKPEPGLMDKAMGTIGDAYNGVKPYIDQGVDATKQYFGGVTQDPMKWVHDHPVGSALGGAGAAALLTYMLMNRGRPKRRRVVEEDEDD